MLGWRSAKFALLALPLLAVVASADYIENAAESADSETAAILMEAIVAKGFNPREWPAENPLASRISISENGSLIGALRGLDALSLAGSFSNNHLDIIMGNFDGVQFGSPQAINDDVWAIRILRREGESPAAITAAAKFILSHQQGGWGWSLDAQPDADMTGMAMEALAGLPDTEAPLQTAYDYLAGFWGEGIGQRPGDPPNCNSTVWAMRGSLAMGRNLDGWSFLESLGAGGGAYRYQTGGPVTLLCSAEVATLPTREVATPSLSLVGAAILLLAGAIIVRSQR